MGRLLVCLFDMGASSGQKKGGGCVICDTAREGRQKLCIVGYRPALVHKWPFLVRDALKIAVWRDKCCKLSAVLMDA